MNTDATTTAQQYYAWAGRDFAADAYSLALNPQGVMVYTPQLVVMMKPVDSRQPQEWAELAHSPQQPDAWYVHLLVGDMKTARQMAHLVAAYRWVCFQRGRRNTRLHCLSWARILSPHKNTNNN